MFFEYHQNNTGGVFTGPAMYVVVEADTPDEADLLASGILGLYFEGCYKGIDCLCCGDRWYQAFGDGSDQPEIYGKPVGEAMADAAGGIWDDDEIPYAVVLPKGSTTPVVYGKTQKLEKLEVSQKKAKAAPKQSKAEADAKNLSDKYMQLIKG